MIPHLSFGHLMVVLAQPEFWLLTSAVACLAVLGLFLRSWKYWQYAKAGSLGMLGLIGMAIHALTSDPILAGRIAPFALLILVSGFWIDHVRRSRRTDVDEALESAYFAVKRGARDEALAILRSVRPRNEAEAARVQARIDSVAPPPASE